jgi:enediyne polyketide synthase
MELWANILEGRRSFRAIPKERLDIGRYSVESIGEADSITPVRAGLLTNWTVDRNGFRIPKKTFATTDLTHWLALELAAEAIIAIGGLDRIDRTRTAVIVGNTLTGEFSRASLLRLRLPFLQDAFTHAIENENLSVDTVNRLANGFATELRRYFPDPNEDSLAGGLANTIAGRIANHFDLRGGAYSVDGACASSLVALADAANLLASGQADAVVVAAVDLSLDPFELVGFSRNGALATREMRVFDAEANGFWPGEGGACAVLMRHADAAARNLPILARIRGWGISSDGAGGLTRPSSEGQLDAYRRAYEMAGVSPSDIAFVEAHGTGTAVGDPIEVRALATLHDGAGSSLPIGSIKANIGHTKAAAGFAGLVKVVEALRHGLVPPHVSCERPHPVFAEVDDCIRPILTCEPIDDERCALAGVSSFGFGGINAHIVIERVGSPARPSALPRAPVLQDAELFLFSADNVAEIVGSIAAFERRVLTLSTSEFADAAAHAASTAQHHSIRVAIVASQTFELAERLARAKTVVTNEKTVVDSKGGVFVGRPSQPPRIGFLFPGQGAPCRPDGGLWRRRFANTSELVARLPSAAGRNPIDTAIAQPSILAASLAALHVLEHLGISAVIAAGHSLGEIAALTWSGALDQDTALDLALKRGSIMACANSSQGAMLRIALSPRDAEDLAYETGTVVACRNGSLETVLSGPVDAIAVATARCRDRGIEASRLAVSHAFHSPQMKPAAEKLAEVLDAVSFGAIRTPVASTISGELLIPYSDLRTLLIEQITKPVLFDAALEHVATQSDCLVEVGPGQGLTRLVQSSGFTAYSVDGFGDSIKPLLGTVGALFAAGVNIRADILFEARCIRSFEPGAIPHFLESPCGSRDTANTGGHRIIFPPLIEEPAFEELSQDNNPLTVTLSAISHETGLDVSNIATDHRFLDALHLNSLAVTRIVTAAAKALGIRVPSAPTEFANATPQQLADALMELRTFEKDSHFAERRIAGVRPWVRTYGMKWTKTYARPDRTVPIQWSSVTDLQMPSSLGRGDQTGLSIWIDRQLDMAAAEQLVALVSAAAKAGLQHLALCHTNAPVAAFARSVAQEGYFQSVRVVDYWKSIANDPRIASALSTNVSGYYEVRLAFDGGIEEPAFVPIEPTSTPSSAISASDVVVVVGGGKGIAAECAFQVARWGAVVILVGRSSADDPDVAATLTRAKQNGINFRYVRADVLNPVSLSGNLVPILAKYGPVTTLIYAPAINDPKRLTVLDSQNVRRTLAPKTIGLSLTLQALGPSVKRVITFGSIIGRLGLEGESHYALANAMQTTATEAWAGSSDGGSALAIEWSVWGGAGMGERLGTIERLSAQGVDAISIDHALETFNRLITTGAVGTVTVTSRFGPPTDLSLGPAELPMLRFVDDLKIHFPGTELVVETTLSHGRDLYLGDHVLRGNAVLPAVMGLEAMAQVTSAVAPLGSQITISDIAFHRALNVPSYGTVRIRIAALRTEHGATEVNLFAEDDGFSAPYMQASFNSSKSSKLTSRLYSERSSAAFSARILYGPLFFGGNSFQRLEHFETATSRTVAAFIQSENKAKWFGSYEPGALVLWDSGATDAALHALQVAVPHRQVIPISVDQIEIDTTAGPPKYVTATEIRTTGSTYTFDVFVNDAAGRLAQHWTNVTFRTIGLTNIQEVLAAAPQLAGPYLERMAREMLSDDSIEVSFVCDPNASRQSRRSAAIGRFGLDGKIERRTDGRPVRTDNKGSISIAHAGHTTLAIAATGQVGCDMEKSDSKVDFDVNFLRRHTAIEACRKLGRIPSPASICALSPGKTAKFDDLTVATVELPLPSGSHIVSFASINKPNSSHRHDYSTASEVMP